LVYSSGAEDNLVAIRVQICREVEKGNCEPGFIKKLLKMRNTPGREAAGPD